MKKLALSLILGLALVLTMGTIALAQTPTATNTPVPTATPVATATAVPTATLVATAAPTATAVPTATVAPTATAAPTATPAATATAAPTATGTPAPTTTPVPPVVTEINGTISAIDATAKTVTITPDGGTAVALNVVDTTDIEVPGNDNAALADLQVGQIVEAKYETASKNAIDIEVKKARSGKIEGNITAIDTAANKVTITPQQGAAVELTVTDTTDIKVWGKDPATIADLKVGDSVKAQYDPATKAAIVIEVKNKGEASLGVRQGFFGTVKSKTDTSFVLTTKQGDVTLGVNADTQYWNPPSKNATFADVKVGARVAVLAAKLDSALTAKRVLIIPEKPVRAHLTGTVTKIEGTVVTVTDKDGNVSTLNLPKGQVDKLAVGDTLTIAVMQTPGGQKGAAKNALKGDELKERLKGFLDKAKEQKADNDQEKANRATQMQKVDALIQRNMERQQEVLKKVIEKAPEAARQALQKAMDNARQGWEQARATATANTTGGKPTK